MNHALRILWTFSRSHSESELLARDSSSSILIVLQLQVQEPNQSQHRERRNGMYLTAKALYSFSETVGKGIGLVGLST